jgi:hypothetical protein
MGDRLKKGEPKVKFKGLVTIAAALSLVTVSSVAVAQSAPQPATESVQGDAQIHGSSWIVGILALSAVIAGLALALKNNSKPASP